jgi:hypothetical protein
LAAQPFLVKISRATPLALAATRVRAFNGRSAVADVTVAVADARIAAEAVRTAVADVPIAADAPAAAAHVSDPVPAAPGMTGAIREAMQVRHAVRSSFPRC